MSLTAAAMRQLADYGLSVDQIITVAALCEGPTDGGPAKSKAALRTEKWRAKKASQTVTSDVTASQVPASQVTSQNVTDRHAVTPLARVSDNPSKIITLDLAAVAAEQASHDWPSDDARICVDALVAEVGTSRLDPAREPGLTLTLGRLVQWRLAGASWRFDVIPTVTSIVRKRGPPIKTWNFFDSAIAQSIANNRKALEIPEHERPNPDSRRTTSHGGQSRTDANFAGAALALNRRRGVQPDPLGSSDGGGHPGASNIPGAGQLVAQARVG